MAHVSEIGFQTQSWIEGATQTWTWKIEVDILYPFNDTPPSHAHVLKWKRQGRPLNADIEHKRGYIGILFSAQNVKW